MGLGMQEAFSVREASNGKEALEEISANKPDIILLDVTMPVMDGIQTYKRLKENPQTKNIPVIFLSARPYGELVQKVPLCKDAYIEKPFEFRKLNMLINKAVKSYNK